MKNLLFSLAIFVSSAHAASVWVEGEDASTRTNKPHPWWYDKVKTDVLSGGQWLSHFTGDGPGTATYSLDATEAGLYTFWVRANHVQTVLSYRLDGGEWNLIDMNRNQRGAMNIAADNKPDLRFIAWVKVGKLQLANGAHKIEFKFHSKNNSHGAIDCFCLTTEEWVPSGATKPGKAVAQKEQGADPKDAIWIEGEEASVKNIQPHGWYDSVKKDTLSGGAWASHFTKQKAGMLEYDFQVITADSYTFWLRANPVAGASLSWRLDNGDWQLVDWKKDARGTMNIAIDNKPDMRYITWVKADKLQLDAGNHKLSFRMDSQNSNHGAIDCFTLVRIPFIPSGSKKPTVQIAATGPGDWFPFIADSDEFSAESVIDISRLIEAPAGKRGFLMQKGDKLQFEKDTSPVKFWAFGSGPDNMDPDEMEQAAKWYRKHGVNLVRQHTVVGVTGLLNAEGQFDPTGLDRYDRWFAAMKKHGIYSTWSVLYPHHGAFLQKHDGYEPEFFREMDNSDTHRDGNRQPIVLNDFINLDRRLQDIVLKYFDKLLNHTNPHTGLKYKDDPALAILEFQNESNIFFHTLNGLRDSKQPLFARMMRQGFHQFLKKKYKTKTALGTAWDNLWDRDDKWEDGEMGLMGAYHWGSDGPLYEFKGHTRRAGDYIEFLTELQKGYYDRREQEVRQLGFKGVTVTTAWRSGGPAASAANLYSDTAAQMIDRHNYFGGGEGGHGITEGKINNQSHLGQPGHGLLNLALFQVGGRPFAVSEWSMLPPAPFKAEAAPLYAFYGMGLQGWDASYHFNCGRSHYGDGWPNLSKYVSHTPHYMGQFPALAFALYNNHIKEGEVVAARRLTRDQLFTGKDELGQALSGGSHDLKTLTGKLTTPPEVVAIGRVTVNFDGGQTIGEDLTPYWDQQEGILTSTTGELVWNYKQRYVEVRSEKTQAIIGFAGGKTLNLPGVTVRLKTPFVSLIFTPLDNQNLIDSRHILITAMARDKQTGAVFNEDGSQLTQVGGPPLLMEPVEATLTFKGSLPTTVRPLDVYGVPRNNPIQIAADGSFVIDGTQQTFYYEVIR
ncbi:MAG: beta-galactosidase [Planctomycetota bacterium]|nr:beta-galactosidase [Planctomycetota bacterium]